jgi:hypothetical protein
MLAGYLHRQDNIDSEIVRRVAAKLDMELLVRRPQQDPANIPPAALEGANSTAQLAHLLAAALAGKNQTDAGSAAKGESKPGPTLTGKLTEKLPSKTCSGKSEFKIQVSLEREYSPGVPIADHYYCRGFYVSEDQAKDLQPGKPIRIKFEQD